MIDNYDDLDTLFNILKDTNSFPFFALSVGLMVCFFIMFLIFFVFNKHKKYYHRRDLFLGCTNIPTRVDVTNGDYWIFKCFFWSSDQIYEKLGIDSMILLKTMRMFLYISIIVSFICVVGALPIHMIQSTGDKPLFIRSSLSVVTDYRLLWVHFVLLHIISFIIMIFLYFNWKDVIIYRQKLFMHDPFRICSLLFSDLNAPSSTNNELTSRLRKIVGDNEQIVEYNLRSIHLMKNALQKHDQLLSNYLPSDNFDEDLTEVPCTSSNEFTRNMREPLWSDEFLENYQDILYSAQTANHACLPATIVAISNVGLSQTFRCTSFSINNTIVRVSLLPEPNAIIWRNLELDRRIRYLHSWLIHLLTFMVIVFCSLPFVLVAAITKSITLTDKHLINIQSSTLKTILQYLVNTIIPIILVNLFILAERLIFQKLSSYENLVSLIDADFSVLRKMCVFNALDTFFAFTFTTTLIDIAIVFLETPFEITKALASSIPIQSNFFMIYLAFQAFIMMPWYLVRGNHFFYTRMIRFKTWVWNKFNRTTPRRVKYPLIKPLDSEYVYKYANILLIFGIGLVFSLLSPLIAIVWIPFFMIGYIFYAFEEERNNINPYLYNGEFWPIVSDCVLAYVLFMQVILIGMFAIKNFTILAFLTIPSCFYTIYFGKKLRTWFYTNFYYPTYDTMKVIKPLGLVEMYERCKPYYVESYIPSQTSTTSDLFWDYIIKREKRNYSERTHFATISEMQ